MKSKVSYWEKEEQGKISFKGTQGLDDEEIKKEIRKKIRREMVK